MEAGSVEYHYSGIVHEWCDHAVGCSVGCAEEGWLESKLVHCAKDTLSDGGESLTLIGPNIIYERWGECAARRPLRGTADMALHHRVL